LDGQQGLIQVSYGRFHFLFIIFMCRVGVCNREGGKLPNF